MLSGALLQRFCPDSGACDRETGVTMGALGDCDGRALWGVIGALTCTSPLLILLTQARSSTAPPLPCPAWSAQPQTPAGVSQGGVDGPAGCWHVRALRR